MNQKYDTRYFVVRKSSCCARYEKYREEQEKIKDFIDKIKTGELKPLGNRK